MSSSSDAPMKKLGPVYLCSKCNAANVNAHEDHKTDLDCREAWQGLATQVLGAIELGSRKIKEHQRIRHMGFKVHNKDLNLCTRCLFSGFSAFQHVADLYSVMPKNRGKGGFVNGLGPSLVPREGMPEADPAAPLPLPPALDPAPQDLEGGARGDVEPGDLLRPPGGPLG